MGIVSYAQNFEDVLLWRALGHLPAGSYIDIGAQDPTVDSVSRAFYEKGWRGMNVEPSSHYADLIRNERPEDIIVQSAVSDRRGLLHFYEVPDTGWSTASAEIAQEHRLRGLAVLETIVPCVVLDDLLEAMSDRLVGWLKIDVEGHERQVLEGWRCSERRPAIVVVESTYPNSQREVHGEWEHLLLGKGYHFATFDGLNRYYFYEAFPELKEVLRLGANVFDGFQIAETFWGVAALKQRYQEQLGQSSQQNEKLQAEVAERSLANQQLWHVVQTCEQQHVELREALDAGARQKRDLEDALMAVRNNLTEALSAVTASVGRLAGHQVRIDGLELLIQSRASVYDHRLEALEVELPRRMASANERTELRLGASEAEFDNLRHELQRQRQELTTELHEHLRASAAENGQHLAGLRQHIAEFATVLRTTAAATEAELRREIAENTAGLNAMIQNAEALAEHPLIRLGRHFRIPSSAMAKRPTSAKSADGGDLSAATLTQLLHRSTVSPSTESGLLVGRPSMKLQTLLALPGTAFVQEAYYQTLGRTADEPGLRFYMNRLEQGFSKEAVLFELTTSKEGRRRRSHGDLTGSDEAFLTALYQRLLGRRPDAEGFRHYMDVLKRGIPRSDVIRDFEFSQEGGARRAEITEFNHQLDALVQRERARRSWRRFFRRNEPAKRLVAGLEFRLERSIVDFLQKSEARTASIVEDSTRRLEELLKKQQRRTPGTDGEQSVRASTTKAHITEPGQLVSTRPPAPTKFDADSLRERIGIELGRRVEARPRDSRPHC